MSGAAGVLACKYCCSNSAQVKSTDSTSIHSKFAARNSDLQAVAVALVLILAASFVYVIAPLVQLAEHPIQIGRRRRRLARGAAIALVYVLMAAGVAGGAALSCCRAQRSRSMT